MDAVNAVRTTGPKGEIKVPVKAVNILKAHGKGVKESVLIKGYALNCTVASQGKPKTFFIWEFPFGSIASCNLVHEYSPNLLLY